MYFALIDIISRSVPGLNLLEWGDGNCRSVLHFNHDLSKEILEQYIFEHND